MWSRFLRTSGNRAGRLLVLVSTVVLLAGCNYTFRAGSGLPAHVRTIAIVPFENDTGRFELTDEIHRVLMDELPGAFGVTATGENSADAVVTGTIRSYEDDAPLFRPGEEEGRVDVVERQVTITLEIRIVDVAENLILWDDTSLRVQGEYLEASESEEAGREEAIGRLVRSIVDGIQSDW